MITFDLTIPDFTDEGGEYTIDFSWTGTIVTNQLNVSTYGDNYDRISRLSLTDIDFANNTATLNIGVRPYYGYTQLTFNIQLTYTEQGEGTTFQVFNTHQSPISFPFIVSNTLNRPVVQNNLYYIYEVTDNVPRVSFTAPYTSSIDLSQIAANLFEADTLSFRDYFTDGSLHYYEGVKDIKFSRTTTFPPINDTFTFVNDNSGEPKLNAEIMSSPIQNVYDPRGWFVQSKLKFIQGESNPFYVTDTHRTVNIDLSTNTYAKGIYTLCTKQFYGVIDACGVSYKPVNTNKQYELIYKNLNGGWDFLFVNGKAIESYNIDKSTYDRNFDNTTLEFGKINWKNTVTRKYKLTTDYLTDEQSSLMKHLLLSTCVYLYDMINNVIVPVIITDTSFDTKFFKMDKKCIYYTINVEDAQITKNI